MHSDKPSHPSPTLARHTGRADPDPPPGVEYHRVLAGEKRRVGRGIAAIALLVAGLYAFSIVLSVAAAAVDARMGYTNPTFGGTDYTPLFLAANLVSIALLIPWSRVCGHPTRAVPPTGRPPVGPGPGCSVSPTSPSWWHWGCWPSPPPPSVDGLRQLLP
jgi:hypothetical protein